MIGTFGALFCLSFIVLWLCLRWLQSYLDNPKRLPLPPGPKPLPLIGNYYDMPKSHDWLTIKEWQKEHGDLLHVKVFGTHFIYINTLDDARALLDKRSTLYSDRPKLTMTEDIAGWHWFLTFLPYGPIWRKHRRLFHQHFHAAASEPYKVLQLLEARRLALRLLDSPDNFVQHIRLLSAATIMRVVYGIDIRTYDDEFVKIAEGASESIAATTVAGKFLVDLIPLLKYVPEWFPGAEFQRLGKQWRVQAAKFKNAPFDFTKSAMQTGRAPLSAVSTMLKQLSGKNVEEEEELARNVAGVAYAGGSETTVSSLLNFLMAMILHPEAQKKAQAELDSVLGPDRLPTFEDRPSLPYIEALIMETFRWHPVLPIAPAHKVTQHDEYKGYFIPKGTVIMPNAWAILHDDKHYPNPEAFIPERFLDQNGRLDPTVISPDTACFGFGRRICPGRHMGFNTVFITAATILSVFDLEHALNDNGEPIPVKDEVQPGFLWMPLPFQCYIKPREGATAVKIKDSLNELSVL